MYETYDVVRFPSKNQNRINLHPFRKILYAPSQAVGEYEKKPLSLGKVTDPELAVGHHPYPIFHLYPPSPSDSSSYIAMAQSLGRRKRVGTPEPQIYDIYEIRATVLVYT